MEEFVVSGSDRRRTGPALEEGQTVRPVRGEQAPSGGGSDTRVLRTCSYGVERGRRGSVAELRAPGNGGGGVRSSGRRRGVELTTGGHSSATE